VSREWVNIYDRQTIIVVTVSAIIVCMCHYVWKQFVAVRAFYRSIK